MIQEGRCINARKLRAQCTPRRQSRQATMHCIHTFGTLRRHELGHIRKNRRNVMIEEKGKRTPTITIANGSPTVGTLDIFPTKDAHRPRKNAFKAQTTAHLRKTPSNVGRTQCSVIVRIPSLNPVDLCRRYIQGLEIAKLPNAHRYCAIQPSIA